MERRSIAPDVKEAEQILQQLLEYTNQLASCGDDPAVDILALTRACRSRQTDLEEVLSGLPEALRTERQQNISETLGKTLAELYEHSSRCIETLKKAQGKIAVEMDGLGLARRAVGAYGAGGGKE
jgi:nucleoside phosphorylase